MSDNPFTQLNYGRVHVRRKGSTLPPFELGAYRQVEFTPELNELTVADPRTLANSELDGVSRPAGGALEGELLELAPETLVALLAGRRQTVASESVADESVVVMIGRTSMLKFLPLSITSVKSVDDVTTYVANTDYVKTPGGLRVLPGSPLAEAIAAVAADTDGYKSLPVKVTYVRCKTDLIQAFMKGREFWEVFIETMNEAGQLNGRRVTLRRARIALSGSLPLINRDDFAAIGVTFNLSQDPNFFVPDESAFFVWEDEVIDE
ncbi:hypothetical protein SA496_01235 [Pseudomonas sp. JS3066]|uniref:hypothetical protein n=1 Tax=Pseudomonas sp. JS3066 TaxID=3090665 RepID=UPI002E7C0268|nr:hypothetical protein [Pseudomonas sp. JS3066]WVK93839.1 hypothetical protein SA496_01235 [Pseudomonas sp. JS3066]